MADFLQAVGLVAAPPTDPKQLQDQQQITQQTSILRTQLRSVLSSVDFAIQGASLAGLSTTGLESLKKDISATATSVTLSPAELEKKRAAYEAEFDKIKDEQGKVIKQKQETDLQAVLDTITARNKEISADTKASDEIKRRFNELQQKAEYALKILKAPPTTTPPDPAPLSTDQLQNELAILNIDKAKEEDQEFSWSRFFKRIFYQTRTYFWYTFIAIGALLGGIFASNLYINEPFWLMRSYYFIYGATFFPLAMLYTLFRPPVIFSTIIPLFQREAKDVLSIAESFFYFERLDSAVAEAKLGHTKMYARIFVIGYIVLYATYFFLYYGLVAGWDALKNAFAFS